MLVVLGKADLAAGLEGLRGVVTFREADPKQTGVTWIHDNAKSEQHYLPETEPPGVAIFDCNNDGCMDLLLVNTCNAVFFHPKTTHPHALYRNNCDGTFTDVTEKAVITADLFGMGVAVGMWTRRGVKGGNIPQV
jgi:enediyne biosynthesis protein E4